MGQRRIVNGKEQIFDNDLLDWRDVEVPIVPVKEPPPMQQMNLFMDTKDWVLRISDSPMPVPDDFVCGACRSGVEKITVYKGWMCESLDPTTGEISSHEDDGIDEITSIRYVCSQACGWSAKESWWLDLNGQGQSIALDIETPEVKAPEENGGSINLGRDLWPEFDISKLFRSDPRERDFPRSYTWGSFRSTPRTSGDKT